ncbi:MAG: N-acetylmuramoyl-L-alanine amidase [Phycisphaerales bacterium JB041]
MHRLILLLSACVLLGALATCASPDRGATLPGTPAPRLGDEIVIAGHLFHTGAPVVLWFDEGGYDAYRTDKRFARPGEAAWSADSGPATPNRYSARAVQGDPSRLSDLQRHIDQFVIHYDAAGTSRQCFKILHDLRGLSSHFLLDLDGTIYQTLDLKEKAWHATIANDRSIGIEIANIGAYPLDAFATDAIPTPDPHHITTPQVESSPLADFYARDKSGYFLTLPGWLGDGGYRTPGYLSTYPRPARPLPITGEIQGQTLAQFDLTDAQYDSLIRLTATLSTVFPNLPADSPRDAAGRPINHALTPDQFARHRGLLGHYHIQQNKIDPGPAFDWERVVRGARALR